MKKILTTCVMCLWLSSLTAQTLGKVEGTKIQTTQHAEINNIDTCVAKNQANASKLAHQWGGVLTNASLESRNPRATVALRKLAAGCFRQAAKLDPSNTYAVGGVGNILSMEANLLASTDLPAARAMWSQAYTKLALAVRLDSKNIDAIRHWAIALGDEAQALATTNPADLAGARTLWVQARQKNAQSLQINPNDANSMNNWGTTLGMEADALAAVDLPAARALWQQTYDRFAQAIKTDSNLIVASYNMAAAMMMERNALLYIQPAASPLAIEVAADLLQKAKKILLINANDPSAIGAYNLACVYAIEGQVVMALQWLQRSATVGDLPTKSHIAKDKDFDTIRNTSAFAAWFAQLP